MTKELEKTWRSLYKEVTKNRKFKIDEFDSAFSQTYTLLKEHSSEETMKKQYVRLIAEAYLFASIHDEFLEKECLAATVLTERMLNNFAFSTYTAAETASVYVVEAHEEIQLDFNDVNDAITKLAKVYDEAFWKNVND